ncbi:MAG TPA: ribosome silencing factor [Microbacterium sp.]|jgi:ribosome-associated protein|uniref:Ribosomal silencing factor RsfS n=2 Tax=Agromyces TaxID=33877 RepID=A0A4Q2JTL4_9MICO|nr:MULTISPECIES: ribosome silencing factor [Agromyces]KQZ08359.1 ribosomal silencing factor RsfS [Agromyces sp. Root1464]RXZ50624.1 ribosome silencing factor [Agromyces fucosus]SIN74968.1 ribosome-associated protein [Agromyces cerinus subsp. cerinus]
MTASDQALETLALAARAADSKGGDDLVALDVSRQIPFADVFLIVTGNSERNVIAIADEIEDVLGRAGTPTKRREGHQVGRWILLDFGDLVVHVFHQEERLYYGLERLWADCPALPVAPLLAASS